MIGELIAEFKGKTTGIRVLAEGKMEDSDTGSDNIIGTEATVMNTGVLMWMPSGVLMVEGNAAIMTAEGDVVMVKVNGIGWSTGKGWKQSARGAAYFMTSSTKLANLNKISRRLGTRIRRGRKLQSQDLGLEIANSLLFPHYVHFCL